MTELDDVLKHRLFGFGMPYLVRVDSEGKVTPLGSNNISNQATELATTLRAWVHGKDMDHYTDVTQVWSYSMPFGRCGILDLPCEHLQVFNVEEAFVDVVGVDSVDTHSITGSEVFLIEPMTVVRLRLRPAHSGRALVAFQTEDQTPLLGNAGPLCLQGELLPGDPIKRLVFANESFERLSVMSSFDREKALRSFFSNMFESISNNNEIERIQAEARSAGSYDIENQSPFFEAQKRMLTKDVLDRIYSAEEGLFRYPGMFGAVAPLFPLLN